VTASFSRVIFHTKFVIFSFAFLLIFSGMVEANSSWVEDSQMKFKIKVPDNYQKNRMTEGTDVVHAFVSPDQNVAVRIRSFPVNANLSVDQIISVFEQNILKGSQRLVKNSYVLNSLKGTLCGYRWRFNNIPVGLGVFYTIQNNTAYVVWSIIPENLFKQRTAESDAIINTFTLIQDSSSAGQGLFGSMNKKSHSSGHANIHNHANAHAGSHQQYFDLVSDDAQITHKVPQGFELDEKTQGQSIWKNDSGIKMVVQTIENQGPFKPYMDGIIADIKANGAQILSNAYTVENSLPVANYIYSFGDSYFAYGATQGNGVYYLVGFVGKNSQKDHLKKISEEVNMSLKAVK
jgi:hypothetical protein